MLIKSLRLFSGFMKTKQFPTKVQYLKDPGKMLSTLFCTLTTLLPLVYLKQWVHLKSSNEAEVRLLKYFYRQDESPVKATFPILNSIKLFSWGLSSEIWKKKLKENEELILSEFLDIHDLLTVN